MKNGGAIVLTRMLTDDDRQTTDIMITIPLLPRGKKADMKKVPYQVQDSVQCVDF